MVKRSRPDSPSSEDDAESPLLDIERLSRTVSPASIDPTSRAAKITHLDASSASDEQHVVMKCLLPPHQPLNFTSFEDYEVHYQKAHVNRCSECYKNFPSDHYLGLHIAENHDPLNEIKRSRGEKTYACFVSDCDRLCSTPHKRRLHLIDKHQFPKYYDFFVINDGLDKRNSLLRTGHHRRRSSTATTTARARAASNANVSAEKKEKDVEELEGDEEERSSDEGEDEEEKEVEEGVPERIANVKGKGKADADVDNITASMSALKFVPKSVRFGRGRGRGRGGFAAS